MITNRHVPPRYLGIRIARLIVAGLVGEARAEFAAGYRGSWRVCEARALCGACLLAQSRGWRVGFADFI